MGRRELLLRREAEGWDEFARLVDGLTPEELERPGYTADGWAVRDLLWHVARWSEEAAGVLERIAAGTWGGVDPTIEPGWIERRNQEWFAESRTMAVEAVLDAWRAWRRRMLAGIGGLPRLTREADEWFEESGPLHYAEHLPDLRRWVDELRRGGSRLAAREIHRPRPPRP